MPTLSSRPPIPAQIDAVLEKQGSDKSRILDATIFLADKSDFAAMNKARRVGGGWSRPGALHGGSDADEPAV